MSDSMAKAERSKAKDARQMQGPEIPRIIRQKKEKLYVVKYKWINPTRWYRKLWGNDWVTMGWYRKIIDAEKAIEAYESKNPGQCEMKIIK